jgi:hypothetical protein
LQSNGASPLNEIAQGVIDANIAPLCKHASTTCQRSPDNHFLMLFDEVVREEQP